MTRPVTAASCPTTALPTSCRSATSASRGSARALRQPRRGLAGRALARGGRLGQGLGHDDDPPPAVASATSRARASRASASRTRAASSAGGPPNSSAATDPASRPVRAATASTSPAGAAGQPEPADEPVARRRPQRRGRPVARAGRAVEPGPSLDRLGRPDHHRQRLGHDPAEPAGPPQREDGGRDAAAAARRRRPSPAAAPTAASARRRPTSRPAAGHEPAHLVGAAEQPEREGGVAALVEPVVGQQVAVAEQGERARPGRRSRVGRPPLA